MKPTEEIKCGMECIRTNASRICIKPKNGQCPRCEQLVSESLGRIQQLESQLAQVERERDAAVKDLAVIKFCALCEEDENTQEYGSDRCHSCVNKCNWKWRGVVCDNR